jgi:hypothetical protein
MPIQKVTTGVIENSPSITGNLTVTQTGTPVIAQFNRTDAGAGLVVAADTDGPYFRATAEGDAIRFNNYLNNSEHARINGSGYLGLGTSNPTSTLHVSGFAQINSERWLNPLDAYRISGGTQNRNATLYGPGGEYYAIFYIIGLWPYSGDSYGTRIVEVTGFGSENRFTAIRNQNYGVGGPSAVNISASGGNLILNITYNSVYRFRVITKQVFGSDSSYMGIDGTNA